MNVRAFRLSDYVFVSRLLQEALTESCCADTMSAFARQLSWDSDLILVAEENEEIVGVIIGTIDKNKAYYYRVAVHPDFRRRGIAMAMIRSLKQRFVQRKVERIMVTIDEYNEPFISIYEAMGCREDDFFRSSQKLSIVAGG